MNRVQKVVVTALCAALILAVQQTTPAVSAETQPTDQKSAPSQQAADTGAQKQAETPKTSPDDPVAKVGKAVITRGEMARAETILLKQNQPKQPLTAEQTKQVEDYVVEQLIAAELLYQAGLKVEPKDLDKQVAEKLAQGRSRFATKEEYENALKTQDIDEKQLTDYTRKEIIVNNLIEKEIAPKAQVSDEEIKKFYDENRDRYFSKPEQVRASHILIGVDQKADDEAKKKAKEKAEALLKEVKEGKKDFAELAKANSSCPSSAQGGDLGFFGKGQMVAPFEQAAFALKPGEVSGVVETQFGYHIVKLTDKKPAENVSLEEAKPKIAEFLKNQKVQTLVTDYINELRSKNQVEKLLK